MRGPSFIIVAMLIFLLFSQASRAEPFVGAYFTLQGAASLLRDADLSSDAFVLGFPDASAEFDFDLGYAVTGGIGYGFGSPILKGRVGPLYPRVELEVGWREHSLDEFTIKNDGGFGSLIGMGSLDGLSSPISGEAQALSLLYNVWLDVDLDGPIVPYFGAGIGGAVLFLEDIEVFDVDIVDEENDGVFAYQLGAGVGFRATPWLMLTLDYRWFATSDPKFGEAESEYQTHNVGVGLRYQF